MLPTLKSGPNRPCEVLQMLLYTFGRPFIVTASGSFKVGSGKAPDA